MHRYCIRTEQTPSQIVRKRIWFPSFSIFRTCYHSAFCALPMGGKNFLNFIFQAPLGITHKALYPHSHRRFSAACKLEESVKDMRQINGVSEISRSYDIILLDQFGVIHDGRTPYPNALNAIRRLHETGLKIAIVSNSSKQSSVAKQKVTKMGVDPDSIHEIVTSGQLTLEYVKNLMKSRPNAKVLHINWASSRGTIKLSDHGVTQVVPVSVSDSGRLLVASETIDFVLAHGTDGVTRVDGTVQKLPLESLREMCRTIARVAPQTPFICANPDFVTVDGGTLRTMPGTLARDYEAEGGSVIRLGKPGNQAYEEAINACGKGRILAIGDSIAHDILGAAKRNIDSLYIAGGIHAPLFRINPQDGFREQASPFQWDEKVIDKIIEDEAPELGTRRPTYISDFFRWQ